jgi:surfactin synthase thioesterase subunit
VVTFTSWPSAASQLAAIVPLEVLVQMKVVSGCVAFYEPLPEESRKLRAFCFYGSGQTAVNLKHLKFPAGVERCIIELPGRGLRASEALCESLSDVAAEVAEALQPMVSDGVPFAVFAYSLGCAVAFEFIRALAHLTEKEKVPIAFYLAVRRPPGLPVAPFELADGSTVPVDTLLAGTDEELLTAVAQYYKNPQLLMMINKCNEEGSSPEIEATRKYVFEKLAPIVRNDMTLGASAAEVFWDPDYEDDERKVGCEILAFAASDATDIDSSEAAVRGWSEVTDTFSLQTIDATHDGILRHPEFMEAVCAHLRDRGHTANVSDVS